MSLDVGFDTQVPSLPDAGGMTASLGETFSAEPSTGTADFSIRIDTPNGPNDIGPRLVLRYDSASGNGVFGLGFILRLPRIVRSIAHGVPRYDDADPLMLEGSGELLLLADGSLQPVVDGGAWRIRRSGDGFELLDRSGTIYSLGISSEARLFDAAASPDGPGAATYAWHLQRIEDALGNIVTFTWDRDSNQLYLATVAYGAYRIALTYEPRPDVLRWGRCGFLVTTQRRCSRLELSLPRENQPTLRRWRLDYAQHELNAASLLAKVTLTGFDAAGGALEAPPLALGYSRAAPRTLTRMRALDEGTSPGPLQRTGRRAELIAWFGSGLPDLLEVSSDGRARVWPNIGDLKWGHPRTVGKLPLFAAADAALALVDLDGDGLADIVRADRPLSTYVPRTRDGFGRPVSWSHAPAMAPADARARLIDADGDGIVDLVVSDGNTLAIHYRVEPDGWSRVPQVLPVSDLPAAKLNDPHVFLADMTGSGSPDLVRVDGGGVTYWPSLGRGRFGDPVVMADPPLLPFDFVPSRLFLQDIDGDGCADLVYLDKGRATYWINQSGCGFSAMRSIGFLPVATMADARWADMSGSGVDGLLWSATLAGKVAYFFLDFVGGAKSYLLNDIDNGCGLVTTVAYATSAREAARDLAAGLLWTSALPLVVPVVAAVERRDASTGHVARTEYRYHEGRYDGALREFAGFGRVEVSEIGDMSAPTLTQVTWFHNGRAADGSEPRTQLERMALRALRGRSYRQERSSPDGTPQQGLPFDRVEQTWVAVPLETPAGTIHRPRLVDSTRTVFERTASPVTRSTTTNMAWDTDGNVTDSIEASASFVGNDPPRVLRTHCDFATDPARRFLSLPWRSRQFDAADNVVADVITEYDGAPEGQAGAQGLVTRRAALVLTDALVADVYGDATPDLAALGYFRRSQESGWWITQASWTRIDDAAGLRGTTTDANGATSSYAFNADRTMPVAVTDPMGNTTTAAVDERIGRALRVTDGGGTTRTALYDALARVVAHVDAGDSDALPTIRFSYVDDSLPLALVREQRAVSGEVATLVSRDLYDSTGRVIERRESDRDGEVAVMSRRFGARGFVARVWRPFRRPSALYGDPGDTVPFTACTFDALGRSVLIVNPDGTFRSTSYLPLLIEESDEEDTNTDVGAIHRGTPTRRRLDATGRVIGIEQNLGGRWAASAFEYDLKGSLVRHIDEAGNEVRFWFDLLGRQLRVRRPERDAVVVRDAMGRPVESRVAGAETVFREFDAAGRPVAVRVGSSQGRLLHAFAYHDAGRPAPPDAGVHTLGGRLVRVDDEAGATVFDYDERGRQAHRRWTPAGGGTAYAVDTEFRADGRVAAVTYPASASGRRRVENVHDQRGRVVAVPTVVPEIDVDIEGRVVGLRCENGTRLAVGYDDAIGRLRSRVLSSPVGWQRATDYTWDKVGNLLAVGSADGALAVVYAYDDLYRLGRADTPLGEHYEYRYADNGALLFKSDVGEYRYGEAGAAPTCLTSAGPMAIGWTATGDIASAPWGEQSFDALGRLRTIARGAAPLAQYVYDWSGRRVVATTFDAQGTPSSRLTPDPLYAIESGALVLNLFAGDQIVAREAATGATTFLHVDHLGSVVAVSDTAGGLVDALRYDPFGRLLSRTGTGPAPVLGFTGGEPDPASGLLYLQARHYHPMLGIFVSVDRLVQEPMNPIAWAAYAYCANNPATRTDPSGLSFNLGKFVAGMVAVVAITALVLVTSGALAPLGIEATSAAVDTVIGFGAATGGLIGGLTVASEERNSGGGLDFWDIALGAALGAAVGGWASFATVYGAADPGKLTGSGIGDAVWGNDHDVLSGALNNMITQKAAGFAHAVARPIVGTGGVDTQFAAELVQSAIAGFVSGVVQSALFGNFNSAGLSDEEMTAAKASPEIRAAGGNFTRKLNPLNIPLSARLVAGSIVSAEQVATSQIEWHPKFLVGTAENASIGTAADVGAAFGGIGVLVNSF